MARDHSKTTRRTFLKSSAALTASAAVGLPFAQSVLGANERVRLGFIGVGNRGTQLLHAFMSHGDVDVAALCDVYEPYLERAYSSVDKRFAEPLGGRVPRMGEKLGSNVKRFGDFRRLLDVKDIDAVVIATPDHWHALQSIMACEAGKDVYVEKPLSITVVEGRKMVEAAKRHRRVVQVGLHRRSSALYQQLSRQIPAGKIGKVTVARAYRVSNMYRAGIGKYPAAAPPEGLDWDMWLGPRAMRPYKDNIPLYKFRWWESYSSQMANWGVHYCDAMRWALGEQAPISISAHGGRFAVDDDRTIPDTMQVIFELGCGCLLVFGQYEASGGAVMPMGEVEFRGTLGNLYVESNARVAQIVPSRGGQFQQAEPHIKAEELQVSGTGNTDLTVQHARNFLDCIKSRKQTHCDMETGHRSTTFALLANIALATKSRIDWDASRERITNNDSANDLLHYEYRKPWKLT